METRSPLICPRCSNPFQRESFKCRSCKFELPQHYGIPSFEPQDPSNLTDSDLIRKIANLNDQGTILEATNEVLGNGGPENGLLKEIYDTRNDAWRILVSEAIDGCCLDLYAGFGRRSLALAEITDTVYAVDPDINKLRILRGREDFESRSSVFPVHGDEQSIGFQDRTFDTVVADFTGRGRISPKNWLNSLDSMIKTDGSILLFLDGWVKQSGASKLIGLEDSLPSFSQRVSPLAVKRTQRHLEKLGYNQITTHTLLPTPEQLQLLYEVGNPVGSRQFVEAILSRNTGNLFVNKLVHWSHRLGFLDHAYPVYVIVGSKQDSERSPPRSAPVISTGRSRSIMFEFETDELSSVWKYPNRRRHEAFNEREHAIVEWLRSEEPQVPQTLPKGELIDTKFGTTRKESPVAGQRLSEAVDKPALSAQDALELGLEWLLNFQRPEGRDEVALSPAEFVERFSVPEVGIEPPRPSGSTEFFETPIHGDFKPENVYVDAENVSAVIDWEYGAKAANPVIDAGFFILNVLNSEGHSMVELMCGLLTGCSSVDHVREGIREYSERVDIPHRSILLLLPTVYVHRIKVDRTIDAQSMYTTKERERAKIVHTVWNEYQMGYRDS